jgi:hypothetical protein
MEFEISLKTSGIHDGVNNIQIDVHSEITIRLDLPGVVHIYNNELVREGIMELLRIDNAIGNKTSPIEFQQIES